MSEVVRASDAALRGVGVCRTCLAPIWNEGGTVGRQHHDSGWSDRIEQGGDSLVCFKAAGYRHVPLTGREAAIYDHATRAAESAMTTLVYRCTQCGKWSHAARKPRHHQRFVLDDGGDAPAEDTIISYEPPGDPRFNPDDVGGWHVRCGPFDTYRATPVTTNLGGPS